MAALLEVARAANRDGTPHEVLWAVWAASGLAVEWEQASAAGGPRGALADSDLDAVVALFDAAARFTDRLPHADRHGCSLTAWLEHERDHAATGWPSARRAATPSVC